MLNVFEISGIGAPCDLAIPKGADFGFTIHVEEQDTETGLYGDKDLTGYTGEAQIRPQAGSETLHAEMTVVIDADLADVAISISAEDSADMTWKTGVFDVFITAPTGERYQLAQGRAALVSTVTV